MNPTEDHVITDIHRGIARLTLNRPKALNALSLAMIQDISKALSAWHVDPSITHVLMRGSSLDKSSGQLEPFGAFCAGGDIRYFYEAVYAGPDEELNRESLEEFFTTEYTLNHLIHHFGKPVIAFMDGVVMGGGMGLAQGASLRIVTERTKMAMPETAIGLFPDVGGGYFLSRCALGTAGVGEYLALTGQTLNGREAIAMGLADIFIESKDLLAIWSDASKFTPPIHGKQEITHLDLMQEHFTHRSLQGIINSLQSDDSDWAKAALAKLRQNSPLMLAITLEQVRRARHMSLSDDLQMERNIVYHAFAGTPQKHSDTVEGIRALVIDKDRSPKWQPASIGDVTPEMVNVFFASPQSEDHVLKFFL